MLMQDFLQKTAGQKAPSDILSLLQTFAAHMEEILEVAAVNQAVKSAAHGLVSPPNQSCQINGVVVISMDTFCNNLRVSFPKSAAISIITPFLSQALCSLQLAQWQAACRAGPRC